MKTRMLIVSLLIGSVLLARNSSTEFPKLNSPYLGQKLPGIIPELVASGIVCTGITERDIVVSPEGKEIYFSVAFGNTFTIMWTRFRGGR